MNPTSKIAVVVAGIAAAAGAVYVIALRDAPGVTREPEPPALHEAGVLRFPAGAPQLASLRVEKASAAPLPLTEPLNGRIAFDENVTARVASPIAGRVTQLTLQAGDVVKKGDPLVWLDSPELAAASADLGKAQAELGRTRAALERTQKLVEGGVVARKDLENAEADHAQARAEATRAEQRLRNLHAAGTVGSGFALRAPVSGIVAQRNVNPGMEVRPDLAEPLFVITDPSRLWVIVDLPERDLAKVTRGRPALVEVDAYPEASFPAVVTRIGETVDPATRRIQVRLDIDNAARRLKPEMYARVTLVADAERRAVRVPNSALVTQGLYSYVFVENAPGTFERRRVAPSVQDREWTYLDSGLASGESYVSTGALLLNSELAAAQ